MKGYLLPFVAGLALCLLAFLVLDLVVMEMQGLSLIYSP